MSDIEDEEKPTIYIIDVPDSCYKDGNRIVLRNDDGVIGHFVCVSDRLDISGRLKWEFVTLM